MKQLHSHYDLTDSEFEIQFESCQLLPDLFNHEAHLRLAWIYINKYGLDEAIDKICVQLSNYTKHLGAGDKFNKTVTIAAIRAVYHFMLKSNSDTFKKFIAAHPDLKFRFKELLNTHYGFNIFSEKAKKEYLEPDLLPFDRDGYTH